MTMEDANISLQHLYAEIHNYNLLPPPHCTTLYPSLPRRTPRSPRVPHLFLHRRLHHHFHHVYFGRPNTTLSSSRRHMSDGLSTTHRHSRALLLWRRSPRSRPAPHNPHFHPPPALVPQNQAGD